MRIFISIIFSIIINFSFSQRVNSGFCSLKEYDYFKAKKIFYKNLKKSTVPASFGLSVIFYRNDNPFHNYDSAYKYCMMSLFAFNNCSQKNKSDYIKFGINDSTIHNNCDSVFYATFSYYLKKAELNPDKTESVLNHYISWHYFSTLREEVIKKRDQTLLSSVKKIHNSETYKEFIEMWPESGYLEDAYYLLDKAVYEESTTLNTITAYSNFVTNNPKNRFVVTAQNEIFKIHKKNRDREGLIQFIRSYPMSENCNEAWKLFFTLSVNNYSAQNLADFVLDYPEFPFKNTIIQEIELLNKPMIKIKSNEFYGFIDTLGELIIPATHEELGEFSEGLCIASENEKYGFIDKNGKWIIRPIYDEAENFIDGVSIVRLHNKAFLIDRSATKISDEFDEINQFSEGLAIVRQNEKYGAINRLGNMIILPSYEKLGDFHNEHAWYQQGGKFGILDKKNFITIANEFEWVDNYSNLIRAKRNGGYGVINSTGNVIIPFEFERIEKHSGNIFLLVKNGKYGFADASGCYYSNFDYDFDNKLNIEDLIRIPEPNKPNTIYFRILKNGEQSLTNQNGKLLCDLEEYEEIYLPSSGLIRVFKKEKYSFLDLKMKPAFSAKFESAEDFVNDFSIVKKNAKWQIIEKSGNIVFSEPCETIERPENLPYRNQFFIVKTKTGTGLLNQKLKWVIQPEYQEISFPEDDIIHLIREGKQSLYLIDKNKIIWSEK